MNYQETLDFLYPLHRFGIKPGLDRVRALLQCYHSPQHTLGMVVHIAGTNGKGTVAAALASIFQAAGKKTALYTSPHLVDFTERIRINGKPISQEQVAHYCSLFKEAIVEQHSTFFEATTAIAFSWFADEKVDVSIIETGMGGRLDATNVVTPSYVVIPSIGFDHTEWLGTTLATIATEKAAIIKKGCAVFTAVTETEALQPIQAQAAVCDVPLFVAGKDAMCKVLSAELGKLSLAVTTVTATYPCVNVPLTGSFHATNVTLAIMVAEHAGVAPHHIATGLEQLQHTGYRARLEKIASSPTIVLDVSHNPDGMQATVSTLLSFRDKYKRCFVMLGLASDKNAEVIVRELCRLECSFVIVPLPSERSMNPQTLAALCTQAGAEVVVCNDSLEGITYLTAHAQEQDFILITGSFYLAGEVLKTGLFDTQLKPNERA